MDRALFILACIVLTPVSAILGGAFGIGMAYLVLYLVSLIG
tara:strand:- start:1701 stop:1823 length:123 start_codon:yes stop_codon:yes gene_type:complete